MKYQPSKCALDRPPFRLWLEAALAGLFDDNLDIDVVSGASVDDALLVAAVHPRFDDFWPPGSQLIDHLSTGDSVVDARGGHQHDQQQAEMDRQTGRIRLNRTLFTATQYPADYGFIEHSLGENTNPLDALVLVQEPTFPGCLIRCRAIGMFRMRDEKGPDPKVLCVPTADPRLAHLCDITDLEHFYRLEIQHFFYVYKDLEPGKSVDVERGIWANRAEAEAEITRSYERARILTPAF
jgi:inorganic pyrophosphatase